MLNGGDGVFARHQSAVDKSLEQNGAQFSAAEHGDFSAPARFGRLRFGLRFHGGEAHRSLSSKKAKPAGWFSGYGNGRLSSRLPLIQPMSVPEREETRERVCRS